MKKLIGQVTPEERDEIRTLFERKNGLEELMKAIDPNNDTLYNKIVSDMGKTVVAFQKWWDDKSTAYQWENQSGYSWEINFENGDIYLTKN